MQARAKRNATRCEDLAEGVAALGDPRQRLAEIEARIQAVEEATDAPLHMLHDRIAERSMRRRTLVVEAEPAILSRVMTDIPSALTAAFEASDGPSYAVLLQKTELAIKADR